MKKMFATTAAALMLSAGVALAATPTAPTFSVTTTQIKVGEGDLFSQDGRNIVVDGSTIYASYSGNAGEFRIVRSTDGGLTWGQSAVFSSAYAPFGHIALAKDPLNTSKKVLCAIWPGETGLQYAYFRPNATGWSTPVTVANFASPYVGSAIVSSPDGKVHMVFNDDADTYYTSAATAEASFSAPVNLGFVSGNLALTSDASNSLYLAETGNNILTFHKKLVNESAWTTKTLDTNTGDNVSIAVYDANNIYIAYLVSGGSDVALTVTSNGGTTWTKRTVNPAIAGNSTHPSIAVNANKVIALASFTRTPTNSQYINKSSDNGATWSPATQIANFRHGSVAFDSAGKINMVSFKALNGYTIDDFTQNTNTDPYANAIYFTKEK